MSEFIDTFVKFSIYVPRLGLLTRCFVPRGGFLYTVTVPGGRVFLPSSRVPGLSGGMVLDEIHIKLSTVWSTIIFWRLKRKLNQPTGCLMLQSKGKNTLKPPFNSNFK